MRKEGMEEDRADDCVRIEFGRVARKGGQPPTALQSPARECARDGIQFFLMKSPAYGSFYLKALLSFRRRCPHGDLVVIRDAVAVARFEAHFERMWDAAQPMIEFGPAINALEPK
jgi:hypothetical protein